MSLPTPGINLHRTLLRLAWRKGNIGQSLGPVNPESAFLLQYGWCDGTPLLHTSTAQLRHLQALQRHFSHQALTKWETQLQLGDTIPASIWTQTWLNFCSANENTFLRQVAYRLIAAQHWRLPTKPIMDISTWCTRCTMGIQEDILHCLWSCPLSRECWHWGEGLLTVTSTNGTGCNGLLPKHVLVAQPLHDQWQVPECFWQILIAVICWQIWKDRNCHCLANQPASQHRVI